MPLYALLSADVVRRVSLTPTLEAQLEAMLGEQFNTFASADMERVRFDGRLSADDAQLCEIKEFSEAAGIFAAVANPMAIGTLSEDEIECVRGLAATINSQPNSILLQSFDVRQVLARRGLVLVITRDTFSALSRPVSQ